MHLPKFPESIDLVYSLALEGNSGLRCVAIEVVIQNAEGYICSNCRKDRPDLRGGTRGKLWLEARRN